MGIDYGMGKTNVDAKTGIRFGVINQNEVGQAWYESSEPVYGEPSCCECGCFTTEDMPEGIDDNSDDNFDCYCPECERGICSDNEDMFPEYPECHVYDKEGILAHCGESDIWIEKSPYYTWCDFCSPCAPGAGYLTSNKSAQDIKDCSGDSEDWGTSNDCKAYCLGHEWFEDNKAPYAVFSVETNKEVRPVSGF